MNKIIVLDTSILFSAMLSEHSSARAILLDDDFTFYCPNYLVLEIYKHKERLMRKAKSDDDDVYDFLNKIL